MTHDTNGLGFTELTYLSIHYPGIYEIVDKALDNNPQEGLQLARKAIEAIRFELVGK